jgi:tetratricopeptide (TPR) repeat protein
MITRHGEVKILDFGLAKLREEKAPGPTALGKADTEANLTEQGRVLGTPAYMSPEQARGEPVGAGTDVFSLGVILYEMLSGTRPFAGRTTQDTLAAVLRDTPKPVSELSPSVPPDIERIVERCMEKLPEARYPSGAELLSALDALRLDDARTVPSVRAPGDPSPSAVSLLTPEGTTGRARRASRAKRWWLVALACIVCVAGVLGVRSRAKAPPSQLGETGDARGSASAGTGDVSHSSRADAERLFDEAMRSFHDGTGQAIPLLEAAVTADPGFGAAYLRLWWLAKTGTEENERAEEYQRRVVALEASLSPRDRSLFDCLEEPVDAKLDAYLGRYPDDDVAWTARVIGTNAFGRMGAAESAVRPTLVPVMALKAATFRGTGRDEEAAAVLARCLEVSSRAVDCLAVRAELLDRKGECTAAVNDVRRWIELQPDSRRARPLLAGLLAAEQASSDAIRDALGEDARSWTGDGQLIFEALVPELEGDFVEVERLATAALARVPSSASELDHFHPAVTLVLALTETGDVAKAGQVAADYLARRVAWKEPTLDWLRFMIGAAARGGRMDHTETSRQLDATFAALVAKKDLDPSNAWAASYAGAAETPAEALAALAKLDALRLPPPTQWRGAFSRTLFLAGRGEDARPWLEQTMGGCSGVLRVTRNWIHSHLYLGELDEQAGNKPSACTHYAAVLARWAYSTSQRGNEESPGLSSFGRSSGGRSSSIGGTRSLARRALCAPRAPRATRKRSCLPSLVDDDAGASVRHGGASLLSGCESS